MILNGVFCTALSAACNVGVFASPRNDDIKLFKYPDFLQKLFYTVLL